MRREERRHLKENPLAGALLRLRDAVRGAGRIVAAAAAVAVVGSLAAGGYVWRAQQRTDRAGELLAEALAAAESDGEPSDEAQLEAVDRLLAVADAYPNLQPGVTARYEAAAALAGLGRTEEAADQYRQVIDAAGGQFHGRMAVLGLAETHVLRSDYDAAVALLKAEADAVEPDLPVDAVLMRLGRAYELAGREGDARAAFTRVAEEFPFSVYSSEASRKADALGG